MRLQRELQRRITPEAARHIVSGALITEFARRLSFQILTLGLTEKVCFAA